MRFDATEQGVWTVNPDGTLYEYVSWHDLAFWGHSPYIPSAYALYGVLIDAGPDRPPLSELTLVPGLAAGVDTLFGLLHRKLPRA